MPVNCNCNQPSREQLLSQIYEVGFAVVDIQLYLDTHPCDEEALEYYRCHARLRAKLMKQYAELYGPLTIDDAVDSCTDKWKWLMQPFPWDNKGGGC